MITSIGQDGGERQIKHVASGQISATSTDGVNGSQLYATQVVIGNAAQTTAANFGGGVTVNPDGSLTAPAYVIGGTTYNNLGSALAALAAVPQTEYVSINDGGVIQGNQANNGALANNSIAIGPGAATQVTTAGGVAIGQNANVLGGATGSIAVGPDSRASGQTSIAMGSQSAASGVSSTAIGRLAQASNMWSIAIGDQALATGMYSTAIGERTQATNYDALAIGHMVTATGRESLSIGNNNRITGGYSGAFGNVSEITGSFSYAVGSGNTIYSDSAFVLGADVTIPVGMDFAVVLGANIDVVPATEVSSATVGGITYGGFSGVSRAPGFVTIIGGTDGDTHQLKGMSSGEISASSHDGINGSQLYATQVVIDNVAQTTAAHLGGGSTVNPDGTLSTPRYSVGGAPYNNVGAAITAQDIITTEQGNTTASSFGANSTYNLATGTVTAQLVVGGNTYNNVNSALNAISATASSGWNLSGQGTNASNVAPGADVDLNNSDGNIVVTKSSTNNDVTFDLADNITVTSVVAGNTTLDTNGIVIVGGANGPVSLTNAGLDNGGNTITHVAAGVNSTDAVNVGQLNAATGGVTTAGMNFSGNDSSAGDVHRDLGQTLSIRGEATTAGTYSGGNIRTVTGPSSGAVNIQIAD